MNEEKKLFLKPLTTKPTTYNIGAFDIEGVGGPDGHLVSGCLVDGNYSTFTSSYDLLEFIRRRKHKGYRFFAHNLSYDWGILERHSKEDDYTALVANRVFKVRIANGKNAPRYLCDSLLFAAGLPLSKLGDALGYPKGETPNELINFSPDTPIDKRQSLLSSTNILDYLKRDVEIVYRYMDFFQQTINDLGGTMKFTIASTAMDLFRRAFLKDSYRTPFLTRNMYARESYYGGRVEPFRLGVWENVNCYDINSLYPYVMNTYEFPDPNYLVGPIDNDDPSLIYNFPGISYVEITVPKMHIPPLPYRYKGKLYFPYGTFKGHYTHAELINAVELGCTINQVFSTLYSTQTCNPFREYVSTLYNLRLQYKAIGDPRELVIKILLNSLYGKFAQRTDAGLREVKDILWWLDGRQHIQVDWRQIGDKIYVLVPVQSTVQPAYVNVIWASYITSYARMTLLNYLLLSEDKLVYGDTDSIYLQGELETSKELGGLKLEHSNVTIDVYGPKAYILYNNDTAIGVKCKGIPAGKRLEYLTNNVVTFSRPTGYLEAGVMNRQTEDKPYYPSQWREVTKHVHDKTPKREFIPVDLTDQSRQHSEPFLVEHLP